jgi:hypothetical protein
MPVVDPEGATGLYPIDGFNLGAISLGVEPFWQGFLLLGTTVTVRLAVIAHPVAVAARRRPPTMGSDQLGQVTRTLVVPP